MPHPAPHPHAQHLSVPNRPGATDEAIGRVASELERHAYPKASLFAVRLALHEAITNGFRHGHKDLPDAPVTLHYHVRGDAATFTVEDQGPGFDPSAIPDPTLDENLERGSGRGLLLIRAYMAEAEYNARGNALRMVYKKP